MGSYDSHVWLPRASQNYRSFEDFPDDYAAISAFIERIFPEVTLLDKVRPHQRIVQQALIGRLSANEIEEIRSLCKSMGRGVMPINLLQVGSHFIPAVREQLGTSIQNPPEGIHRMQTAEPRYIGDIYSANMILSSLARLGWNIERGKRYLDFGCSSGSLIRMFKAYVPAAEFHGIDPILSSIEWANANIPGAYFQVSNPFPRLPTSRRPLME